MPTISPGGLVTLNSAVNVERSVPTQGADGGTVQHYATVASAVPVLITSFRGGREHDFDTDATKDRGRLSGIDPSLLRGDTRLLVVTPPPGRPEMAGWYLRVESPTGHPAGQAGLAGARVSLDWSHLPLPTTDGVLEITSPVVTLTAPVIRTYD